MAEPMRKVSAMTLFTLTPMSAEVLLSWAEARMARPMRVRSHVEVQQQHGHDRDDDHEDLEVGDLDRADGERLGRARPRW